jgi:hypothetical protein
MEYEDLLKVPRKKRVTAGMMSLKAASDETDYDLLEVGYALTEDLAKELIECVRRHNPIFEEDEYCVGYLLASDPLIKNVMRRKFFAMLYLPSPRPNQTVFLYNKKKDQFVKRLWVLPNPKTMAIISEMPRVDKRFETMKSWSDAFFEGRFWQFIRKQHDISMLSQIEYLNANREKLVKSGCKESHASLPQSFDFSKITTNQVINTQAAVFNQDPLYLAGQTKSLNRHVRA